jgi:hypothetical protein
MADVQIGFVEPSSRSRAPIREQGAAGPCTQSGARVFENRAASGFAQVPSSDPCGALDAWADRADRFALAGRTNVLWQAVETPPGGPHAGDSH